MDASYKCLVKIIGQRPMGQMEGEYHALFAFLGAPGQFAAISAQSKEGVVGFGRAAGRMPLKYREEVKYIFVDNPDSVDVSVFPNLLKIAEDPHPPRHSYRRMYRRIPHYLFRPFTEPAVQIPQSGSNVAASS